MVYRPRYLILQDGTLFHVSWSCNDRLAVFRNIGVKKFYYELLQKYHQSYRVHFHSYCFLDASVYLTGFLESQTMFSRFFRLVNSVFSRYLNKPLEVDTRISMGRFKSLQLISLRKLSERMIWDDLSPCRSGLVEHPVDYPFSSYRHYAWGHPDLLVKDPGFYQGWGRTPELRQKKYRALVDQTGKKEGIIKTWNSLTKLNWLVKKNQSQKKLLRPDFS